MRREVQARSGRLDFWTFPEKRLQRPGWVAALGNALGTRRGGLRSSEREGGVAEILAESACTAYSKCMQYTIRNVPDYLDAALRRAARARDKSLNEVAIEALARGAGLSDQPRRQRDLGDLAGTWRDDPVFEAALAAQDTIDQELWPKKPGPRKRVRKRAAA
jgi:hypothetical protein